MDCAEAGKAGNISYRQDSSSCRRKSPPKQSLDGAPSRGKNRLGHPPRLRSNYNGLRGDAKSWEYFLRSRFVKLLTKIPAQAELGRGTCDPSRRCTRRSAADGRSVSETTMRTVEVVMLQPRGEMLIAFLGVEVVADVGPLAQGGLNKAFGLAVGAGGVRAGEAVLNAALEAGGAELAGAIAASVIGEQAANGDAVLGVEGDGSMQESDSGFGLLVGEHAGEGEAGVIINGDM